MEGRSLGTERPSVSTLGGEASGRSAEGGRFTSFLQSRAANGTGTAREARETIEDDVATRIRDGRTDAADAPKRRGPVARDDAEVRDQRAADREQDAARQAARESEKSGSERKSAEYRAAGEGAAAREKPALTSRERSIGLTNAADAQGSDGETNESGEALFAPVSALTNTPLGAAGIAVGAAPGGGANVAASISVPLAGLAAGRIGRGAPTSNPTAQPAARTEAATRAAAAQKAAPKPGATSMQRAEAILDQLRMRIQAGEREATIQLNPADLGRIRMHVRVDGGSVSAAIAAENAETLAVLEAHAPELRAWLSRDGAERVELELELFTPADAEDRSDFDRSETGDRPRNRGRRSGSDALPGAAPEALVRTLATRSADGGVDLVA